MLKKIPLGLMTVLSAVIACLVIGIEFFRHFSFNNNAPIENWVTTATYFNNAFSPVLLLASIFLLYRTWSDSKEALEVQKRELEATKEVLKEQSDTQNFSVFKEALFEVTDQVNSLLKAKVLLKHTENEAFLYTENSLEFISETKNAYDDDRIMTFSTFLYEYFLNIRLTRLYNTPKSESYKNLIFTESYQYIEKLKTIALLLQKQESNVHRDTLEIIIFHRLHIFVWLMFLEIAFHLLSTSQESEKHSTEVVFEVIAGITSRQLKEGYWLNSLSDEVLTELKARKLLTM